MLWTGISVTWVLGAFDSSLGSAEGLCRNNCCPEEGREAPWWCLAWSFGAEDGRSRSRSMEKFHKRGVMPALKGEQLLLPVSWVLQQDPLLQWTAGRWCLCPWDTTSSSSSQECAQRRCPGFLEVGAGSPAEEPHSTSRSCWAWKLLACLLASPSLLEHCFQGMRGL